MSQIQSFSRGNCALLAVLCGKHADKRAPGRSGPEAKRLRPSYPFPELGSSGRLEVHTLFNPTPEQFLEAQRVVQPNFLYIQGRQLEDDKEIGSLVWGDVDVFDVQAFSCLISPPFPTIGLISEHPYLEAVDWSKWHVFWVDERVVPKDNSDSNYKLAMDGLLSKVPIPASQVYGINDALSAEGAADDYNKGII